MRKENLVKLAPTKNNKCIKRDSFVWNIILSNVDTYDELANTLSRRQYSCAVCICVTFEILTWNTKKIKR